MNVKELAEKLENFDERMLLLGAGNGGFYGMALEGFHLTKGLSLPVSDDDCEKIDALTDAIAQRAFENGDGVKAKISYEEAAEIILGEAA